MRLGVIIFTLGAAFVAGAVTAPAADALTAPPTLFGARVQRGAFPAHADAVPAVSYVDWVSPKGDDFRADTSASAFSAWQASGLDSYG
jgi:hypothetical protein